MSGELLVIWSGALTCAAVLLWWVIRRAFDRADGAHVRIDEADVAQSDTWKKFLDHLEKVEQRHAASIMRMEERHTQTTREIVNRLSENEIKTAERFIPRAESDHTFQRVFDAIESLRKDIQEVLRVKTPTR